MKTRIISTILVLAMMLGTVFCFPQSVAAADDGGLTFPDKNYLYQSEKVFDTAPRTIEAWVKLTKGDTSRVGVIIGSYGAGDPCFALEIHNNGIPRLFWQVNSDKGEIADVRFPGAATMVMSGEWVHLVIVRDLVNEKVICYANGTNVGEAFFSDKDASSGKQNSYAAIDMTGKNPFCIGGDLRSGNSYPFKGTIKGVSTYSTALTAEQVAANYKASKPTVRSSLICYYDLSNVTRDDLYIKDLTGNGHNITIKALGGGLSFKSTDKYQQDKIMDATPNTYEAWVKLPSDFSDSGRPGVIIGSYSATGDTFSFELNSNRVPRIYWTAQNTTQSINFDGVNVPKGSFVHIVIVRDTANEKAYCYLNGVKQTKEITLVNAMKDLSMQAPLLLGGDYRVENGQSNTKYFQGTINGVALYSECLTEAQIQANYAASKPTVEKSLLCSYDLSKTTVSDLYIDDLSGNGYNISKGDHVFNEGEIFEAAKPIDTTPNAFEAWVKLPKGYTDRPGIILGTYGTASKPLINFELTSNSVPRLYWMKDDGGTGDITFGDVKSTDICTGSWVHIAITRDVANGKVHCYINGALKQSKDIGAHVSVDILPIEPFGLGADYRTKIENDVIQNFKGSIKAAAIYSTCLTAEQIAANYKASKPTGDATNSFICYYDLTKMPAGGSYAKDYSGNGYDLTKYSTDPFLKADDFTKEEVKDFDYTFVVVGDTQTLNDSQRTDRKDSNGVWFYEKLHYVYDWIIENKEEENIKFVMGMGDITENYTNDSEWTRAMEQILRMKDAGIPFSLARGNHDDAASFDKYYPYSEYSNTVSGAYDGSMRNTYQKFTVGNRKYLVMALDCGPTDDMVAWAEQVIAANPDYNVIITTHSYLYRDGTTHDYEDLWPVSNNHGEDLWQKLVKKYANIRLVLNGHDPVSTIITNQTAGDNGNIVTSMLIDGQYDDTNKKGVGLVALLHFSEDSDEIQVEYVSTVKSMEAGENIYYRHNNQFSITLDLMEFEACDHVFENGICTKCEEWDGTTVKFLGANVALNNSLSVKYYAKIPAAYKGAQMKFTMNGYETVVDGAYLDLEDQYVFSFDNIPPQCISDNIKAELIFGGEVIAVKESYSVYENVTNLLAKNDARTTNLVKALLNYGAAAQKYAQYNTNALVNNGYEINSLTPTAEVSVREAKNNTGNGVFKAAGVYFDGVNQLYVKILADEMPTVTINGTNAVVEENGNGEWIVYTDGIFVVHFDKTYTFVITSNDNQPSFTYSVNSYTYAKLTSTNTAMVELAKATYTYGVAAEDYINSNAAFAGEITYDNTHIHNLAKPYAATPNTFEAWIYLPEIKRSVILGNYGGTGSSADFEINANGNPRVYWATKQKDSDGNDIPATEFCFTNVTVPTNEWVHVVITRDTSAKKISCYINGELKQEKSIEGNVSAMTDIATMQAAPGLGADNRGSGTPFFKGDIKTAAIYSTCLTAKQIKDNYDASKPTVKDGLICYFHLALVSADDTIIKDLSGNGYDITIAK